MGAAWMLSSALVGLICLLSLSRSSVVAQENTTTWQNFYHIFSCKDVVVIKPSSVQEVVGLVQSGRFSKIKAFGTAHSYNGWTCPAPNGQITPASSGWTGIARDPSTDKPRLMLDMTGLNTIYGVNETSQTILVDAGVHGADLCRYLLSKGWALKTFPRQPNVTVAGALSTASHGSNIEDGSFSSRVVGVEIVFSNGTIANITASYFTAAKHALLPALRASMGRLGVITKVLISVVRDVPVRRELAYIPITAFLEQFTGSQAPPGLMLSPYLEHNFFYAPNIARGALVWHRMKVEDTPAARNQVQTYQAFYNLTLATSLDWVPKELRAAVEDPVKMQQIRLYNRTLLAKIELQFAKETAEPPVTMRSVGFAAYWQITAVTRLVLPLSSLPNTWKLDIYEVAVQMSDSKTCLVALFDLINSDQKYVDSLYSFIQIRFVKNRNPILLSPTLNKLAMYLNLDAYWYDGPEGVQYYMEWNRIIDLLTGPQCNGVMHWGLAGPWKLYSDRAHKYLGNQLKKFKAIADEVDPNKLFETELDKYFF